MSCGRQRMRALTDHARQNFKRRPKRDGSTALSYPPPTPRFVERAGSSPSWGRKESEVPLSMRRRNGDNVRAARTLSEAGNTEENAFTPPSVFPTHEGRGGTRIPYFNQNAGWRSVKNATNSYNYEYDTGTDSSFHPFAC